MDCRRLERDRHVDHSRDKGPRGAETEKARKGKSASKRATGLSCTVGSWELSFLSIQFQVKVHCSWGPWFLCVVICKHSYTWDFPGGSVVKTALSMQRVQVQSLVWDPTCGKIPHVMQHRQKPKTKRQLQSSFSGLLIYFYNQAGCYGAFQDRPPHPISSTCLLSVKQTLASKVFPHFQRVNLTREERQCRKQGKQLSKTK